MAGTHKYTTALVRETATPFPCPPEQTLAVVAYYDGRLRYGAAFFVRGEAERKARHDLSLGLLVAFQPCHRVSN